MNDDIQSKSIEPTVAQLTEWALLFQISAAFAGADIGPHKAVEHAWGHFHAAKLSTESQA